MSATAIGRSIAAFGSAAPSMLRSGMFYFVWFDDNPKKPASDKLQEAIAAYRVHMNAR
jgi:hypothetical protein